MDPTDTGESEMNSENFPVLQASQEVISKQGKPRVSNTDKSTRTARNAWCSIQLKEFLTNSNPIQIRTEEWMMDNLKRTIMPDAEAGKPLSAASLRNLNISLGEFAEHYRKADGNRLAPATLLTYLESTNRWLQSVWKLDVNVMQDSQFKDDKTGFIHVANCITSAQQASGVRPRSYNTMTDQDVYKILHHEVTNPEHPHGYVNKTIVIVGLILGLRPEELCTLTWCMFTEEVDHEANPCLRYEGKIGSYDGDCKTEKGGLQAAKKLPKSILIFDEVLCYNINLCKYILTHRDLCFATGNKKTFFLAPNKNVGAKSLIKNAVIGEPIFRKYWNNIVDKAKVRGVGPLPKPHLQSLRKALINNLMRSGFTENQIILRTGHSSVQSPIFMRTLWARLG